MVWAFFRSIDFYLKFYSDLFFVQCTTHYRCLINIASSLTSTCNSGSQYLVNSHAGSHLLFFNHHSSWFKWPGVGYHCFLQKNEIQNKTFVEDFTGIVYPLVMCKSICKCIGRGKWDKVDVIVGHYYHFGITDATAYIFTSCLHRAINKSFTQFLCEWGGEDMAV